MKREKQITIGGLLGLLKALPPDIRRRRVWYDFAETFPAGYIESWRGNYKEAALGWTTNGCTRVDCPRLSPPTVDELIEKIKDCLDEPFFGYKGDQVEIGLNTHLWVANPGQCGATVVTGIEVGCDRVIIRTAWHKSRWF